MTSAHICALRHVDNHILFTLAQQTICELVSTRDGFIVTFWLGDGGGAIRWYDKIQMVRTLEDKAFINGLLVNRLKVR